MHITILLLLLRSVKKTVFMPKLFFVKHWTQKDGTTIQTQLHMKCYQDFIFYLFLSIFIEFLPLPFSPLKPLSPPIIILLSMSMNAFFLFAQSLYTLTPPSLAVILLSIYESVPFSLIVQFVH